MNIQELVQKFKEHYPQYKSHSYNETQLRNDFIDPFLIALGWDVDNNMSKTPLLRDVLQEESIEIEDEATKKNPDYTLRINGTRKLFVEVKKPSINIQKSAKSAFQTRRYGWNANLCISILTNFEYLIIYDCRFRPDVIDNEVIARVKVIYFEDYEKNIKEIEQLVSYKSVKSGQLDDLFSVDGNIGQTFDAYFLEQIQSWRIKLAVSAYEQNDVLDIDDLNFFIQRLLNRIIFLRICEDRTIERFETLKSITNYDDLKKLFQQSDKKFNSGLFDFIEDKLSNRINIDSKILLDIFHELYYPQSPYDFSVVDLNILSNIYEKFLGSLIVLEDDRSLVIKEVPEVLVSNGVVSTPKIIVEQIVKDTLSSLTKGKSFSELMNLKILDMCCGSGTFLIVAFDFMQQIVLEKLIQEDKNNTELLSRLDESTYVLTLQAKRKILKNTIYGVDINPYATEVSEFSLLLKLLEGESRVTVDSFTNQHYGKVLPSLKENIKCGNSLVDSNFYKFMPEALENYELLNTIKPFEWSKEFPFIESLSGFDAILGNPPYVRIQSLVKYMPEEINYYQSKIYGYTVANKETIDKYYVFIQRAINLLNNDGYLGYIIPHKFFLIKGGVALREFLTTKCQISKIIHFGVTQVFPNRSTYTAILILRKNHNSDFLFKRVNKITPKILEEDNNFVTYQTSSFSSAPWIFLSKSTEEIFARLRGGKSVPLKALAEITVGLQTSADKVYIFTPEGESSATFIFKKKGRQWEIEKGICLPAIYDLSFGSFDTIEANALIIFPYKIENEEAILFEEEYFKKTYPLAWLYLQNFKELLEERSLQGDHAKWYQFGRSQSLTRFQNSTKLIWSVLSLTAPYTYDNKNLQFTGGGNGPYYALINKSKYSIKYFLGILSHPIFETMVKAGASEFRGAYYSHGKQFIENIPIRQIDFMLKSDKEAHDNIVRLVDNLISAKVHINSSAFSAKRSVYERQYDVYFEQLTQTINLLYGIYDTDLNTVMRDEMFTIELGTE